MKTQRLAMVLLAINLAVLALSFTAVRSSALQADNQILRIRMLELVDANGKVRSRLNVEPEGAVVFRLLDERGTIRVKLGADEKGSGLVLLDEKTEPGVHIVARRSAMPDRKTTSITLKDAGGQRVVAP